MFFKNLTTYNVSFWTGDGNTYHINDFSEYFKNIVYFIKSFNYQRENYRTAMNAANIGVALINNLFCLRSMHVALAHKQLAHKIFSIRITHYSFIYTSK